MTMWIIHILIFNLTTVLVTELPIAFFLGAKTLRKISTVTLANIITNPLVVLISLYVAVLFPSMSTTVNILLEVAVLFAEGFIFSRFNVFRQKKPYLISLALNTVSFLSGELIDIIK